MTRAELERHARALPDEEQMELACRRRWRRAKKHPQRELVGWGRPRWTTPRRGSSSDDFRGFEMNVSHDYFDGGGDTTIAGIWAAAGFGTGQGFTMFHENFR